MAYNRELSQFASQLSVDDTTKKIGIATDVSVSGVVTATEFRGSGRFLTDVIATKAGDPTSLDKQIFFNDDTNIKGAADFYYDKATNRVGIGISIPLAELHVIGSAIIGVGNTVTRIGADNGRSIEVGTGSTNLETYIDFHGSNFYPDFSSRLIRTPGDDGDFSIINRGNGSLQITTEDAGSIDFNTQLTLRHRINADGVFTVGSGTSTGTASQPLQVTGGAYVSGNVGIGTTNPSEKLHVVGNAVMSGITATNVAIGTDNANESITVVGGNIKVGVNTNNGIILTSENGTSYRLFVNNDGTLGTIAV